MTAEVLSNHPEIGELRVADLVDYLQQNQWQSVPHPNTRLLVFANGVDDQGKTIQLVLPSQDSYDDAPDLLNKAVKLLGVLQECE